MTIGHCWEQLAAMAIHDRPSATGTSENGDARRQSRCSHRRVRVEQSRATASRARPWKWFGRLFDDVDDLGRRQFRRRLFDQCSNARDLRRGVRRTFGVGVGSPDFSGQHPVFRVGNGPAAWRRDVDERTEVGVAREIPGPVTCRDAEKVARAVAGASQPKHPGWCCRPKPQRPHRPQPPRREPIASVPGKAIHH